MRRVVREEAFSPRWLEEAVTPIDEFVQKGARTSFEDVRVHRHVVEGQAPIPAAPGRAFIARRTRLSPQDFDDFGYTEGCKGCGYLQTGIGQRQNHSEQCRDRIEAELAKTDEGKARLDKSKDRMDHWAAQAGEEMLNEQKAENEQDNKTGEKRTEAMAEQSTENGEMRPEATTGTEDARGDQTSPMAVEQQVRDNAGTQKPEEFDISGSPYREPEEEIELSSRGVDPSERRFRTPERTPAKKRRPVSDNKESPAKS